MALSAAGLSGRTGAQHLRAQLPLQCRTALLQHIDALVKRSGVLRGSKPAPNRTAKGTSESPEASPLSTSSWPSSPSSPDPAEAAAATAAAAANRAATAASAASAAAVRSLSTSTFALLSAARAAAHSTEAAC
eukprot:CAMPEP_0203898836 /NCGR_PEP_ID=MMETSP0359-20131031/41319_1 /ASSEMBLY_ACC=CAM_ASM_000338 /TAXON_ID=268821 /ORGANISM="Scrippsiella Hangoei, Strain SHTV-5" /LENGTH=132 /DNA_ID=CAMNT_0050821979 /DNA_START=328 /DNA_END=724 /DNA_ORIENTATION=-